MTLRSKATAAVLGAALAGGALTASAAPASAATAAPARGCSSGWLDHIGPVRVGSGGYGWVEMVSDPCRRWWWGRVKCSYIKNGAVSYWHSGIHYNYALSERVGCKAGYQPTRIGINVRRGNGTLTWQVLWIL